MLDSGSPGVTRHIALALGEYLDLRRRTADKLQLSTLALRAARQTGDEPAQAEALDGIGIVHRELQRFEGAVAAHTGRRRPVPPERRPGW
ncbi:hypothetical protein GWI34_10215 [Actinomadura sp. DSM 109109]|nr:hypothetical protein [Actinomadura lepetitiana]